MNITESNARTVVEILAMNNAQVFSSSTESFQYP